MSDPVYSCVYGKTNGHYRRPLIRKSLKRGGKQEDFFSIQRLLASFKSMINGRNQAVFILRHVFFFFTWRTWLVQLQEKFTLNKLEICMWMGMEAIKVNVKLYVRQNVPLRRKQ